MKIGIHTTPGSFSDRWISYCESKRIEWKAIDCYRNDIIQQIEDCDAIMWHFSQNSQKDFLFAKQLVNAVEASGKKLFPDRYTSWHFDDKLGQKYLLESIGAPIVPVWTFYDKKEALLWAKGSYFPKVFKLRGGAGSQNVILVYNQHQAKEIISKAFGEGFPRYDAANSLRERWRLFRLGKSPVSSILKGIIRFFIPPEYAKTQGRERGYVYFQKYIPDNNYDIRVIVIGNKAFGLKRMVRKNDFRASGSGDLLYDKKYIDKLTLELSFEIAGKLKAQCVAFDFVYENHNPMILEISYGFSPMAYDNCPGYWDRNLVWYEGKFDPYGWMVEDMIERI